ncbi:MAG: aminotransferase class I/II-fold pyridoxal phosphate-dependent enzyme [Spirochaetales bacterium]|nr:aminotransferase class I/II-fold pyridoxal phosphate-dependent enzyme [Spirochaetales bacterium]
MGKYQFDTLALHAGQSKQEGQNARGVPVYRTAAYLFNNARHAADLFGLKELGNIYTRLMNPTQNVLEERVAALEGGAAALAVASGTSAIFYSVINIASAGEEIVSSSHLYGGTYTMFHDILPQFGITVRFVPPNDIAALNAAVNDKTRAVYAETIGNPGLSVLDIAKTAEAAHAHGLPLIVDSTFTTPYLLRPIEHGADIVVHSLTKWLGGHGSGIGGIVVDSGKFDWTDRKFKLFNEPDPSYHGLRYAHDLGDLNPVAFALRMRLVPLRNLGAAISPDNAWMFLQGIETLHLRMERHSSNALKVAEFLKGHPKVDWVSYPGLGSDPEHERAKKYLPKGQGGMVVFGIKGGSAAGETFVNSLELHSHVANVGDAKSLVIHPASTTHSQLDEASQIAAGVAPEMVRLSVGIEDAADIIADLELGFSRI